MTTKQNAAVETLKARLVAERQIAAENIAVAEADGKVTVQVAGEWPLIVVGKGGRTDMPAIASFPETGGKTAMDACVDGDKYLAKKLARAAKKAATVTVETATVTTPEQPAEPVVEEPKQEEVVETVVEA